MSFKSALHGRALSANPRHVHSPEWGWFWRHVTHAVNFSYGTNWDVGIRDFGGYVTGWTKNGATIDPVSVSSPWGKAFGNRNNAFDITGLVAAGSAPAAAAGTHFAFVTNFDSVKGSVANIIFESGQTRALGIKATTHLAFIQNKAGNTEAIGSTDLSTLSEPFTIAGYLDNTVKAEIFVNGLSEATGTGGNNWGNLIPDALFGLDGSSGFIGDVACCYSFVGYELTAVQHWQLHNDPHGPFRTNRKPVYKIFMPSAAGGPNVYNREVAETFTTADADTRTATFARDIAEALALVDAATRNATFARSLNEALTVVDASDQSVDSAGDLNRDVAEALTFTDASTRAVIYERLIAESLTFIDASSSTGGQEIEVATKGGRSMTLRQMRRLEREQLLAMIREDDEVVIALVSQLLAKGRGLN